MIKEGTSDKKAKWRFNIAAKNTLTDKVQFNVKLSQTSDLWRKGTLSDRKGKWSFRIEATEARRTECRGNELGGEATLLTHIANLFFLQDPEKSPGRICCRALNLEESPTS